MIMDRRHIRTSESGNIFFMLFASVALVGAFGVGASNIMKGLVASMSDVTHKTIAEEKMTAGARLSVQNATVTQGTNGNCDTDPLVEPLPFRTAGTANRPVGGGYLPIEIGATLNDPWGTPYGYCAWDPGTVRDAAGCGGPGANRRIGMGVDDENAAGLVVAVISAGKDRRFTTTCNDFVDVAPADGAPDTPLIGRGIAGDDIVFEYTYNDANGLSGDDLWRVKDTAPDTAQIDKNVEIAGDASMEGVLELRNRGLLLPNETETGPCTALNEAELRINSSASPSVLEICYDTEWVPISMGSGGGGAPGECGENWTAETTPQNGAGSDIAYGNGRYVSVGAWPGYIMTSTDGVTWTNQSLPGTMDDPEGVTFGNNLFVMTAASGTNRIATSPDGITWTARTAPWSGLGIIEFGNGMFVATGWDGNIVSSPDGINWTLQSATGNDWRDVIYGGGKWVIIGSPPSGNVATSNDGITWTIQTGTNPPYTRLAYGDGVYVGTKNGGAAYSSDGITWTDVTLSAGEWNRVVYTSTGKFIAVNYSNSEMAASEDGITWTVETNVFDPYNAPMRAIVEGQDKLIAVANDGAVWSSFCDSGGAPPEEEGPISLPDPVVHLKLDEQSGTNVIDTMNRAIATLTGTSTPPTVTGRIGRAYDLDGADDRILVTGNLAINNLNAFTISFWTYGINNGAAQYLTDNRDAASNGIRFSRDASNAVNLLVGTGGNYVTNEVIPNNVWTHVALAYNSLNLTEAPIIYLNGVAATYSTSTLPSAYTRPAGNWAIGSMLGGGSWNPGRFDDYRIYGQVLSPRQITALYNDRASTAYVAPNPIAIIAAGKYRGKITAFENQACGIKEDGSAWCWGDEANGSMGNGSATHGGGGYVSPVRVETGNGANAFAQVSMGSNFSCGIKSDRTAWCWGTDAAGQLGNGAAATGSQHNPTIVSGGGLWTKISAGGFHACGIQANGNLYCWGDDNNGQLGTNVGPNTDPVMITEPGPWVHVAAGAYHTCGIKADGSAWCWGGQEFGRLGNGLTASMVVDAATPVLETGPWVKIGRGGNHTCGIKLDGSAWCWGQATNGKLGNGLMAPDTGFPQRVLDPGPWIDIETSQADDTSCGIKYDGTMWCWGTDSSQQLGNGAPSSSQSSPSRVLDPGPWAAVDMGLNLTCGLKTDGSAWCWGSDTNGRLGNGAVITGTQNIPTRVENFPNVAPFSFNDAQTLLTKNAAATTVSLGTNGGRIGYDGHSGGLGFTASGQGLLQNPNGNSGLSIESTGAFDSQISLKIAAGSGGAPRSIGVDNVTGNLEFGSNDGGATLFMSSITPLMVINSGGQLGVGTQTPGARLGITGSGIRIGNDLRDCTLSRKGVLRFNNNTMEYCNGLAWTNF